MSRSGVFLVGRYALAVTIASGATLVDVIHSGLGPKPSATGADVSDVLLELTAVAVVASMGAIAAAWRREPARYLLVASLGSLIIMLLTPVLLGGVIGDVETALGMRIGPWLRLGEGGLTSILALVGWWAACRPRASPGSGYGQAGR